MSLVNPDRVRSLLGNRSPTCTIHIWLDLYYLLSLLLPLLAEKRTGQLFLIQVGKRYVHNKLIPGKLSIEAYDSWRQQPELSYDDFVANLDRLHQYALVLSSFDRQLQGVGFQQWYSREGKDQMNLLREILRLIDGGSKVDRIVDDFLRAQA